MIAVIGCVKETVSVKLLPPKEDERQREGFGGYGYPGPYGMAPPQEMPQEEPEEEDDEITVKGSGCGYNIAVNLAAWGYDTEFISAIGNDTMGSAARAGLDKAGVGQEGLAVFEDSTAVDVELVNIFGDVSMAKKNRHVIKNITPEFIRDRAKILEKAEAIVVDGTIPGETIDYVLKTYGGRSGVKLFFDPASSRGGRKVKDSLEGFYCVMPGRMEAESMSGKTVLSEEQLSEAGAFFGKSGVERSVITIKGGGLYYREGDREGILRPERLITLGSTSGAGDVVSAAVVAGAVDGKTIEEIAADAMEKAALYLADVGVKAVE